MLTCMKPMLLRLQKSTNDSAWEIGVVLGSTGPGLTSTSPEEQRSRIRVWLKAIRTGRLARWEQNKRSRFLGVVEQSQGIMYRQGYGGL
jgi:hypothetical protein